MRDTATKVMLRRTIDSLVASLNQVREQSRTQQRLLSEALARAEDRVVLFERVFSLLEAVAGSEHGKNRYLGISRHDTAAQWASPPRTQSWGG